MCKTVRFEILSSFELKRRQNWKSSRERVFCEDLIEPIRTCKGQFWRHSRSNVAHATVHGCKGIDCRNSGVTWWARVDYWQTVSAGAVTGRQRESIPAGTGTTDLPRETKIERKRQREENDVSRGRKEREREKRWKASGIKRWSRSNDIGEAGEGSPSFLSFSLSSTGVR